MKGGLPSRPRVWMDATFANKWSTGSKRWITRDTSGGDEIQDANKGGKGERFTLLHAFADYLGEDGTYRAAFVPGALNWSRGVAVDSPAFLPWFEITIVSARRLFGDVDFEVHLDNPRVHIQSADFNPRDSNRRRADLVWEAMSVCDSFGIEEGCAEMGDQLRDYLLDATKKDLVRFLTTACGARVPGIFKKATEYGCAVERARPTFRSYSLSSSFGTAWKRRIIHVTIAPLPFLASWSIF